jgi:hypothetical protein
MKTSVPLFISWIAHSSHASKLPRLTTSFQASNSKAPINIVFCQNCRSGIGFSMVIRQRVLMDRYELERIMIQKAAEENDGYFGG